MQIFFSQKFIFEHKSKFATKKGIKIWIYLKISPPFKKWGGSLVDAILGGIVKLIPRDILKNLPPFKKGGDSLVDTKGGDC